MKIIGRLVGTDRTVRLSLDQSIVCGIEDIKTLSDVWICPGLVDIQVNGYRGHDVRAPDVDEQTIYQMLKELWAEGITACCPTVTTGPEERIVNSLRAVSAARRIDPILARAIPCAHVEGPHISAEDGPRGAHDLGSLRPPDIAEFHRWQEASAGVVGVVTLAPELPGAPEYIDEIVRSGVIAAIGHTSARPEDIARAVSAGARLSTHLGNGAHAQINRHPNYIWEQLANDRLMASFVADGFHLPATTLTAMVRAKSVRRSILVSDSVALAGNSPGRYVGPMGAPVELTADGRLSLAGTTLLAGAVRSLRECLAWAVYGVGVPLSHAVAMASANPARLLGAGVIPPRPIRVGGSTDLTLLRLDAEREKIEVVATIVGGVAVYTTGDAPIEDGASD